MEIQNLAWAKAQALPECLRNGHLTFFRHHRFHSYMVGIPTQSVKIATVVRLVAGGLGSAPALASRLPRTNAAVHRSAAIQLSFTACYRFCADICSARLNDRA